jgi:lysophospholipase L1-like esterase
MSLWTGAGFNQGWIYTGINTDIVPHRALDGLWNRYDGVAPWPNQAIVTPYGRQVEIQYIAQPGGGSFHVRHGDFGPIVDTIDTDSPTTSLATYRYTLPAGETKYTIQPAGGSFTVLGQNNVSPNAGVRLHRGANGGWGVNNFLQRDWTFDSQLDLLDPDLIMVWIGQNDQGFTQSSYAAKIDQLVTRLQAASPTARIVLIGTYNQGSSPLAGLVEGMADVALARGLGFINLYATAGSPEFFQNNGYLDDAVHFSPAGGQYMGHFLYNAFISDGWSLAPFTTPEIGTGTHQNLPTPNHQSMPEPGAFVIIGFGAMLLSRRSRRAVTC